MLLRFLRGLVPLAAIACLPLAANAQPVHTNNGSFLGYAYVKYASQDSLLSSVCSTLQYSYNTNRLFVNCGKLNASGHLTGGAAQVSNAVGMLNTIASWEATNGLQFKVIAWFSADFTPGASDFLDVSSSAIRANLAAESAKFTSATVSGSYVAGGTRSFDGVLFDPEPAGGTSSTQATQFNNLKTTMDGIRSAIGSSKVAGFAAPQYNASGSSVWNWTPTYYYYMALHANLLVAMTYDSGQTTGPGYQMWLQSQTENILQAVSGEYWSGGSHPAPTNGVQVMFGFPAYPNNPTAHYASAENTEYAALGAIAGINSVDPLANSYFLSAVIYLTTDGSGSDGYASWSTDWTNLATYW